MDILQEKMQDSEFVWAYRDEISFEGKDKDGYYTVCVNGLENDDYDFARYFFKEYEKLKKFISAWFGETYYVFLCEEYKKYGNTERNENNMTFVWTDVEDKELFINGITILWVAGRTKTIQRFVEALSYKIGSKCDFGFTDGRAHIDVSRDKYEEALEMVNDKEFMEKFIVSYSEETYENETYFEVIGKRGVNEIMILKEENTL